MEIQELGNAGGGQIEASDSAELERSCSSAQRGFWSRRQHCSTSSKQVLWNVKQLPRLKSNSNKRQRLWGRGVSAGCEQSRGGKVKL